MLGVTKLGLFGSYAKDRADVFSDIDIVIETDAKKMVKSLGNPFLVLTFLDDFRKSVSDKFGHVYVGTGQRRASKRSHLCLKKQV